MSKRRQWSKGDPAASKASKLLTPEQRSAASKLGHERRRQASGRDQLLAETSRPAEIPPPEPDEPEGRPAEFAGKQMTGVFDASTVR